MIILEVNERIMDNYLKDIIERERHNKTYFLSMDVLSEIYTRWYGSAIGVTHNDVRNMCDIILSKKSSFTRYKRELNDKIFFDTYGEHLYKNMEGKNVNEYIL